MGIDLTQLKVGSTYSRHDLARMWGYSSFHALSRGVVTPKGDDKIILFVTDEKQEAAEQYVNKLNGNTLAWEGPTDHFAEQRMVNSSRSGEQIHLFHRDRHHSDFTYFGRLLLEAQTLKVGRPSSFVFSLL